MEVLSKYVEDTETKDLFGEESELTEPVPEVKEPPKVEKKQAVPPPQSKPVNPKPQPAKQESVAPGSRKSNQEYKHDESVEGLKKKYTDTSQGIDGFEDTIYLPNGEEVAGVWKLVDAFSISPSHDPFSFHSTKGFPRSKEGSANTRDYYNEPDAQRQVIELAGDFDGRALGFDSAVVVTKDGVVVSGNNRTMSSQLAARKGTDKKYLEALLKRCRSFGFTQEQVQAFEHPRVIFEIDSQDYSSEHFEKYNQTDKKEQTEEARIVKFSKIVKPQVLREMADILVDYSLQDASSMKDLMAIFVNNGVFSRAELPKYFDGHKISAAGRQFIVEYILGGVLSESVVRALYSEGAGNIKMNVQSAAYLLLENWSNGSYSAVSELNKAIAYALSFQKDLDKGKFTLPKIDKEDAKNMTADDKLAHNMKAFGIWASQGDLLEDRDPVVLKLAGALYFSGPLFKSYLEKLNGATASAAKAERETEESGNAGLFGGDAEGPNRSDLLERAVASWNRRAVVRRSILSSVIFSGLDSGSALISPDGVFHSVGKDKSDDFHYWYILDHPEFFKGLPEMDSGNYSDIIISAGWAHIRWFVNVKGVPVIAIGGRTHKIAERALYILLSEKKFPENTLVWLDTEDDNTRQPLSEYLNSSVVMGDGMSDMVSSGVVNKIAEATGLDLQSRIMKWTAADPKNKNAFQQAIKLFTDNFGRKPKSEKDAKIILKVAKKMADSGQVLSGDEFKQEAQQSLGGDQQRTQTGQQSGSASFEGGGGSSVPANDPQALFTAIRNLWKSGKIPKDHMAYYFKQVLASFSKVFQSAVDPEPTGKAPNVRFDFLGNKRSQQGLQVGSRVVYTPYNLSSGLPAFVGQNEALYAGKEGIIRSIKNELYNVEMPDEDGVSGGVVSAYGNELEPAISDEDEILSARGAIVDPMRDYIGEFISNIPSLTKLPENARDALRKEGYKGEPDHVCYWYSETIDNGRPYTIEFHVSPGESFADVFVVRDYDNHPLEWSGYHIEDMEDWNLSEVDHIEGLFAKEKAATAGKVTEQGRASFKQYDKQPSKDYKYAPFLGASFEAWSKKVDRGLSIGRGMGLEDMVITSQLALGLVKHGYLSFIDSGALDMYRKTLKAADKLAKNPMGAVDDMAELPFKVVDKVRGVKSAMPYLNPARNYGKDGMPSFDKYVSVVRREVERHGGLSEYGWDLIYDLADSLVLYPDDPRPVAEAVAEYYGVPVTSSLRGVKSAIDAVDIEGRSAYEVARDYAERGLPKEDALRHISTAGLANPQYNVNLAYDDYGRVKTLNAPIGSMARGVKSAYNYWVFDPEGRVVDILQNEPSEEELARNYDGRGFSVRRQGVDPGDTWRERYGVKSSGDYYADHMANWSKQPGGIYHGGPDIKVKGSHKVYPSEGGYVYKAPNGGTYWYDSEEKALDHRRQMTEFEGDIAARREIAEIAKIAKIANIHGIGSGLGF